MDTSDQPTQPAAPTSIWRTRLTALWTGLGAAYGAVSTRLFIWWHSSNQDAVKALLLLLVLVGGLLLGFLRYLPGPSSVPAPAPAAEAAPGLQDQINVLRLRVIVLEDRADALPKPAVAPRASAPRAGASTQAAPATDQFADTSKLVEPTKLPAPITRQSIDQFRASLHTPQPVQE